MDGDFEQQRFVLVEVINRLDELHSATMRSIAYQPSQLMRGVYTRLATMCMAELERTRNDLQRLEEQRRSERNPIG